MSESSYIGVRFGAFVITGEIGRGGMGVVYSARQERPNRSVALKVLDARFAADPSFVARFEREGELLAKMQSPHVVQVYEHGRIDDWLYLAMQRVPGGDLAAYLRERGPLPLALSADLTAQVASALADAHALGIIHRDVKPSNVLLSRTGSDLFAYLCDFGIAQEEQSELTQTGMLAGSVAFAAPERIEGRQASVRSDLYSLGCLFWILLSGNNPYQGSDLHVMEQHLSAPIPRLAGAGPGVDAANRVLASLLAKDPNRRPRSALDAVTELRALQRLLDGGEAGPQPTPAPYASLPPVPDPQPVDATHVAGTAPREADVKGLYDPTTVAVTQRRVPNPPRPVPAPAAAPPPARTARAGGPVKTLALTVAVVVAAAVLTGGGLWAFSSLFSGSKPAAAASFAITPTVETTTETPEPTNESSPPTRAAVAHLADKIHVKDGPHGIAINPGARLAFVANYKNDSVSVINLDSNTVVKQINVGHQPQSIAVDPASGLLLVGCDGVGVVQIYELQHYGMVGSVSTGEGPVRVTVHSSQKVAYAVAAGSSTMKVISLSSRKLIRAVPVGAKPRVIAVDERDQMAYVGHWDSNKVTVIDLNAQRKISVLRVGKNPNTIAIASEARLAFVGNYGDGENGGGSVSVIDLDHRSIRKTFDMDAGPSRVAVDEDAHVAYLTCLYARKVDVISFDTLTRVDRFSTANRPTGAAVDESTGKLYVTNFISNVVQVFQA